MNFSVMISTKRYDVVYTAPCCEQQMMWKKYPGLVIFVPHAMKKKKQEAHGPRVAHLSDIATADMQMLCNIFPILSSQLMKRSSFKQFFILKKIYGMPVN